MGKAQLMLKKIFILLFIPVLISCSASRQQFEQARLHALKGQSENQVIHLLGTPNQTIVRTDEKKLIYQTNYKTYAPAPRQIYLNGGANLQGTFTKSTCLTVFTIKDEIVSAVKTIGNCL